MEEEKISPNSNVPRDNNFRLDDRQNAVFERLSRLVGPGAADFYHDSCRLMATKPSFTATTHIVGHLLREIESSIRDVIGIYPTDSKNDNGNKETVLKILMELGIKEEEHKKQVSGILKKIDTRKETSHKEEVQAILEGLGIKEDEDVAKAWLALTGARGELHKRAHRDKLGKVRPIDEDFKDFWNGTQRILDIVLSKFETQYTDLVFKKLDNLSSKEEPKKEDASYFHQHIPNNFIAHQRFFGQLENDKWLPLLKKEGVFVNPPEPEINTEEKTTRHPLWPAGTYLEKVASTQPEIVKEILKEAKGVDNSNVKGNLLRTACNLRKEDRLELLPKILGWVKTEHSIFQMGITDPAQMIIEKFIEDGEEDAAFNITTILLEILPDTRTLPPQESEHYHPTLSPHARLDDWYYDQYFKKEYKKLVVLNKKRAFDLACNLLLSYRIHEYRDQKEEQHKFEDNSYIPRGAIEDHEQNHDHNDTEDVLIDAIRDIGIEILKENPNSIKELYAELVAKKWTVFRRLAFFLLAEVPESAPELVAQELVNEEHFDVNDIEHEYSRLMHRGFKLLNDTQKKTILNWISEAHHISEHLKRSEADHGADIAKKRKEYWQRDKLSFISDDISSEWKERYTELVKNHGEPQHPDFPSYSTSWVGPESDKHAKELADMDIDALVEYLKKWEPKENHHFGPSKEGLGRELAGAVKLNPEKFYSAAEKFKDIDPTYIRSYIQVFVELVQNGHEVIWPALIELCLWVVQQPEHIPDRKGEIMDQDPDWSWTRKAVGSLMSRGTNHNSIPYDLREKVWAIIEPLTHSENPTSEDEAKREENYDDAYSLAINSSRSEALGAVIEYSLWVYRSIEKTEGKEKLKEGFDLMPEVRMVLDFHLNPNEDPSIAVRAMYGRFFPWLLLMDKNWVLKNLDKIFPPGQFDDRLYNAAWSTLLLYGPAYDEPFLVLKERYLEAAKNLGKVDKNKKRRSTDKDERLAEHVMLFYGREKIKIDDPLLIEFWKNATDEIRGHALDYMGRSLKSEGDFDPTLIERLKLLWESRLNTAKASDKKEDYQKEMSAFGWWFASARFEDKWSADQYLEALEIGRKTQSDYFVVERLSELVKSLPLESVKILNKMLLEDKPGWIVMGHKAEISNILSTALNAPETNAQNEARELINRLVARGHTEYSDLLE